MAFPDQRFFKKNVPFLNVPGLRVPLASTTAWSRRMLRMGQEEADVAPGGWRPVNPVPSAFF
jgi:hypothetical protein